MFSSTRWVISVGSKNRLPPCTTRWPTAIRFVSDSFGPCSAKASIITAKPAVWSMIGRSRSVRPPFDVPAVCRECPIGSPMRSTRPLASSVSVSMSISWYLNDDDPELTTRMAVMRTPPLRPMRKMPHRKPKLPGCRTRTLRASRPGSR